MAREQQQQTNELIRLSGRVPPHDMPAEIAVLGSILEDNACFHRPDFPAALKAADFYFTQNQILFGAMVDMLVDEKPVDLLTLVEHLRIAGQLDNAGGTAWIGGLGSQVASSRNVAHYAAIVIDRSIRRRALTAYSMAIEIAHDESVPADEVQVRCEEVLADSDIHRPVIITAKTAGRALRKAIDARFDETTPGASDRAFKTGFRDLDHILRIRRTHFTIIAGRPGDGKTAFLWQICRRVARDVGPVAIASLEMTPEELAERAVQDEGNLVLEDVVKPRTRDAAEILDRAEREFENLDITFIDEDNPMSIMREAIRMKRSKRGLALLAIDYLQLLDLPREWGENRDLRIGQATRRLKRFSLKCSVPVLAAAQLRRIEHLQKGRSPEPTLNDLRESGNLEQDANTVLALYRPGVVQGTEEYDKREWRSTKVIVLKQRGGQANVYANLTAQFEYQRFADAIPPDEERQTTMPLAGGKKRVEIS